jgi:hypothetical protein
MSEDILAEYIKNKIDNISETINNQFNPSFLFDYLFPQSMNENKRQVTMEILPNKNIRHSEMNYVALINNNPLDQIGVDYKKRIQDIRETEGFTNIDDMIPKDIMSQMYFASLGVLGIYILYGIMKRSKMLPV